MELFSKFLKDFVEHLSQFYSRNFLKTMYELNLSILTRIFDWIEILVNFHSIETTKMNFYNSSKFCGSFEYRFNFNRKNKGYLIQKPSPQKVIIKKKKNELKSVYGR